MAPDDPMNPDAFRALGLLVALACSMPCLAVPPAVPSGGARAPVAGASAATPGGTNRPAGTARAASASPVEPLSVPLRLSMGAEAVLRQFGTPRSDNRSFGGGLTYPEFRVMFSAKGDEIWSVTLMAPVRLACGLGPGDPMEKVRQRFPGGRTVYDAYEVESGQYALSFAGADGRVSTITLRPTGRRFEDPEGGGKPKPAALSATAKSLAGRWIDPKNSQTLDLRADGSYRTGVGGSGRFTVEGDRLVFTGALAAWDEGRATLTQPDVIEFYWTAASGSKNYFAFLRSREQP